MERQVGTDWRDHDAERNEQARREMLRRDGTRALGENLEQADVLIKTAFTLAAAFAEQTR